MRKLLQEFRKSRFRLPDSFSPTRALLLLFAVVGIVSAGVWLFSSAWTAKLVYLTSTRLSSSQLSQATALLDELEISYRTTDSYILVEPARKDELLGRMDFLSEPFKKGRAASYAPSPDASSIFLSETERQRRWKLSLEKALSSQIVGFKGIREAQVSLPERSRLGFGSSRVQSTASVTVWTKDDEPVDLALAWAIRQTVAGAVAELEAQNVHVIDASNGQPVPLSYSAEALAKGESSAINLYLPALRRRAGQLEAKWERKICSKLSYIPRLIVSVHINPLSLLSSDVPSAKEPGPVASATFEPDISISLSVPRSYLLSLYRRENPTVTTPTDAELQNIGDDQIAKITALAGAIIGRPSSSYIHVDWYYDLSDSAKASAITAGSTVTGSASLFARLWQVEYLVGGLVVVSLGIFVIFLSRRIAHSNRRERAVALARINAEKHYLHFSAVEERPAEPGISSEALPYHGPAGLEVSAFEELLQLDDATLRGVLRRTETQIIALALRTSPDKLRHRILAGLSHERRLDVHDHPDFLGPVRLSDIEAAQQELVDLLEIPDHSPAQLVTTTEESPA